MREQAVEGFPFVSVCIPARNGGKQLPHTLNNLLARSTYPRERFEVLVGDHGSSDDTADVLARFARDFAGCVKHVKVPYTAPNRAFARNSLLTAATGELLVFLDHDVVVCDGFLEAHASAHIAHPGALVAGLTYGKSIVDASHQRAVDELELDHISSSLDKLRAQPAFADPRTQGACRGDGLVDVSAALAPFRHFWSCNLSARRADIEACGGFDERYVGWGLEDDDFANQFRARGKALVFSHSAWGLHVPHAVDPWGNLCGWRHNFEHFFAKFPTRELEYYSLHGGELDGGARRMASIVAMLARVDTEPLARSAGRRLGRGVARRLCPFLADAIAARELGLTDALDPSQPVHATMTKRDGVRYWPFFGLRTPFEKGEIEETVVLVDVVMRLDRYLTSLVLLECARHSKRVVFCVSNVARGAGDSQSLQRFRDAAAGIRFEREPVWLEH